ncbi:adenosine 5'-monophosphoramidase HINT3-like [Anthonomus grandis grandis]|uniref:adenosine 5'-monophosphoramidase HINT3-like n=1 Tax=Anthonomus grandis grandis TaxID=2921223 RepID=UPI002166BC4E|nr:adenosine 5'-monophosphoramidase HINT3-like [Anthonomus grandis grandis]
MSSKCIFCDIVSKKSPADIKLENEEIIIFTDIKPVAKHHYLAIPKEHIENVNSLNTTEHVGLLDRLVSEGKRVIEEQGGDLNDMRLGFHLPPFNTVGHLHLHCISPASKFGLLHKGMFLPGSWWFATDEQIREKISKAGVANQSSKINNKL